MIAATEAIDQFRSAIQAQGIEPPDHLVGDGVIHRFRTNGRADDDSGWYTLHLDSLPAGAFGCWRSDISQTWRADIGREYSASERAEHARRLDQIKRTREAEQRTRHNEARKRASEIWAAARPAPDDHVYLTRKGIKAHGLRVHEGRLVVPLRDADGELHSLQFIAGDGGKRFLTGGRVAGCFHVIGAPNDTILICEGFATAATLHQATGHAAVTAFNRRNLERAARAIREKYSRARLIFCADDDLGTENNPGLTKATAAALAVGADLALPDFGSDRPAGVSDFNDLARHRGLEAVAEAVKAAAARIDVSPEPLPELPDVTPFDYAYLPGTLREYVRDISERMQCPADFAAIGVLVMAATIIGRKVGIRPMRHDDWTVTANLWAAAVGHSGIMKSPTLAAALNPLKKLQAAEYEVFNNAKSAYDDQAELAKLHHVARKSAALSALKKDQSADIREILQLDASDAPPTARRFITNNSSYEALGELLIENPNGLLVESDELVGLLKQLDASGQEVARSFYLTGADGTSPYTFDRILRGKGLHIEAVCLSILGGIQPGALAEYVRQATGGGAGADGLLQRFGLMVYPDISTSWKEVDRYPSSEAREAVNALVERLDTLNPAAIGAEIDMYGRTPFLRFDAAAQALFSDWRATLEHRLRSGEEHPAIVSHLSKYRKLVPSLALINHLCDTRQGTVSEASLLRAIAYSEYLESHARRIYSYATRPDIEACRWGSKPA